MLILNLKVIKQTRIEASKNNVMIKSIKDINKLNKSKKIFNRMSFRKLQKSTLQKSHVILK